MREEMLLGRHGERCGTVRQRIRVSRGGRILYRQDLDVGPEAPGYDGAAVLGAGQAVGSVLVVDPSFDADPPAGQSIADTAAVLPLAGPAVVVSAVADDNLTLRAHLAAGLSLLLPPRAAAF